MVTSRAVCYLLQPSQHLTRSEQTVPHATGNHPGLQASERIQHREKLSRHESSSAGIYWGKEGPSIKLTPKQTGTKQLDKLPAGESPGRKLRVGPISNLVLTPMADVVVALKPG